MSDDSPTPSDDEVVALIRALLDFDLPEPCIEGVRAGIAAVVEHGRRVTHG